MEEERTNGSVIGSTGGSNGVVQPANSGNLQLVKTRNVDLELVAVVVLSSGSVAALLLLIYLSFLYPSVAAQLVPMILTSIGTLVVQLIAQRQQKKNADATITTAIKIANSTPDQGRQ